MNLLEHLQEKLHCLYLSDLKIENTNLMAKDLMKRIDYDRYTLFDLSDAADYLYGVKIKFESVTEARNFFNSQCA